MSPRKLEYLAEVAKEEAFAKAKWVDKWLPKLQRLLKQDEVEVSSSFDAARELERIV